MNTIHDINNRTLALCYIDGIILTGKTHSEIIYKYLENENYNLYIEKRPKSCEYDEVIYEIVFGHIVENEKSIYIEEDTTENILDDFYLEKIKEKFSNYNIVFESSF